jgi:hypothetical protein
MFNKLDNDDQEDCFSSTSGKIQEEEFCRILDLRKNLQFSDVLIKHMSHYLSLGWHLAAVNSQSLVQQLNFQEPKEAWSEKLIELGLDGVEVNVGIHTGSASGLLILEVPKEGRVLPFRREDWSSDCIAEAGVQFEQHYYQLPAGWQLPASFFLDPFEVKVYGEGDLALAPPSLEPRTRTNWRWLKPPWDTAPSQPPPILRKIIKVAAPSPEACLPAPAFPAWEKIYPAISPYPPVLQALMSPASSPESYYQRLLEAALASGLQEPQLLLGLLWHAPLGDARDRPEGWKYLQQLVNRRVLAGKLKSWRGPQEAARPSSEAGSQIQAILEGQGRRLADSYHRSPPSGEDFFSQVASERGPIPSGWHGEEIPAQNRAKPGEPHSGNGDFGEARQEFLRTPQESLLVERRRYEAMIYELGKLQVWREICLQERLENKKLNRKLEAQLAREVDYLRDLLKKHS